MTNPYDPITGKWLTPFAWSQAVMPAAVGSAGNPGAGSIGGGSDPGGGQNAFGGVGKDDGYTGTVDSFGGLVNAVLGGAGMVFGGFPGAIGAGINATNGFKNGLGLSGAAKTLAQALGLMNSGPSVVGGVLNNTTPGDFSGKTGVETSSVGDSNSEHDFAAGDRGSAGDRTAEARGFADGGLVTGDRLSSGPVVRQYGNDDRRLMDDAYNMAPKNTETSARWNAAMDAATGARYNELSPEQQAKFREFLDQSTGRHDLLGRERDIDHARASYPGFFGGGSVTRDRLSGPNPPGPDEGFAALKPGEFVLSAPATQAIGPDVLAALNAALSGHGAPFGWGAR